MTHTGVVKFFSNEKKYGFITVGNDEIFVHFSEIQKEGYKTLKKDQRVDFEIKLSPRGKMATNVRIIQEKISCFKPTL